MTDEQWQQVRTLFEHSADLQRRSEEVQKRCNRQSMLLSALDARCQLLLHQQAHDTPHPLHERMPQESI